MRKLIHKLFCFWNVVKDNGKTIYELCSFCGKRKAWQRPGGHQIIDYKWLETGEWTTIEDVQIPKGSGGTGIR